MFRRPVIVFNKSHSIKEYYTFKKNGTWCKCNSANVMLYLPKCLGDNIQHLLKCAYSNGECDGQFEDEELQFENGNFRNNPMA